MCESKRGNSRKSVPFVLRPSHTGIWVKLLTSLVEGFTQGSAQGMNFYLIFTFDILKLCSLCNVFKIMTKMTLLYFL